MMRTKLILFVTLFLSFLAKGQLEDVRCSVENKQVVVRVASDLEDAQLKVILEEYGVSLDSFSKDKTTVVDQGPNALGWKLALNAKKEIILSKSIENLGENYERVGGILFPEDTFVGTSSAANIQFGFNESLEIDNLINNKKKSKFKLDGFENAKRVFLTGSFCDWCEHCLPMQKTAQGWQINISLQPGRHAYKFVVDGNWVEDPENTSTEINSFGTENALVFKNNHVFNLSGFKNANTVHVAGSFNDWDAEQLAMRKHDDGWRLPVFLRDGNYEYRFIVDGEWMADAENPNKVANEFGASNSVLIMGAQTVFELDGFEDAKTVFVVGDFNGWDEHKSKMYRLNGAWTLNLGLAPGNYQFKYLVDGKWTLDSNNKSVVAKGDFYNHFISISPNETILLKGFSKANSVQLAGTFTDWENGALPMTKTEGGWTVSLHLENGKHLYKFIVDEEWIRDPNNPHWEGESHNITQGNSVLWVE